MAVRVRITSIPLMFLLLCSALLATTLQGVQGEVEVDGPSESECRPYIEKALKKLETGDTQSEDVQDDDIVTTDDADTQSGEAIDSNISKQDVDDDQNSREKDTGETESAEINISQNGDDADEKEDTQEISAEERADTKEESDEGEQADAVSGETKEAVESSENENSVEGEKEASTENEETEEENDETEKQKNVEENEKLDEASVEDVTSTVQEDGTDSVEQDDGAASTEQDEGAASTEQDGAVSVEQEEGASSVEEETTASSEVELASAEQEESAVEQEEGPASVEGADSTEQEEAGASAEQEGVVSAEQKEGASIEQEEDAHSTEDTTESVEKDTTSTEQEVDTSAEQQEGATSSDKEEDTVSDEQEGNTASTEQEEAADSAAQAAESTEQEETAGSIEEQPESSEKKSEASTETHESSTEQEDASAEKTEASSEKEAISIEKGASAESQEKESSSEKEESSVKEKEESAEKTDEDKSKENDDSKQESSDQADEETASKEGTEEDESEEGEVESTPEEDLTWEYEIPSELRPRDHINEILNLNDKPSDSDNLLLKAADKTLNELRRIYENAIKPLETLYKYRDLSNRHFGDAEIFSKPLVLFMGPWSGGKSSIINYLLDNEYTQTSLRTGAEPSPAYFNLLMWGEEPEILDGTQLAADWTFSGLQKFGQGLEERLRGVKLPNKLLEKINIVEIPGILEVRKQVSRMFPFNDACQWFIDRADIIFLVYDPSKLDVGPETEAILDQLKGREYQTRIILNKADQVKPEELMRVQGALIWNISPLMSSAQPPVMYSASLWSKPYEVGAPIRLLQAQERAFLKDLKTAVDKRIENKIASARRFSVRVRNHAKMVDCYLTTYYNHKSVFGNKKLVSDQIIEHPQDYHIYEGLSTLTNISRYDLPDPDVYRDFFRLNPLYDFQQLSATCTYFRGCPINRLDVAIAYDLPELVGKYKKMVEPVTNADSSTKS